MAYFRFHKSLGILPGLRVNLSKSGPSLSVGPVGLRLNVGPQGIRTTAGLPGSGLSVINRKSWRSMGAPQSASGETVDDAPDGPHEDVDGDVKAHITATPTNKLPIAKLLISIVLILLVLFVITGMFKGVPLAWGIAVGALTLIVGKIIVRRFAL